MAVIVHGAVGWSAVCDCGVSWSYSLTCFYNSRYGVVMTETLFLTNYEEFSNVATQSNI